jgi:hypothetical protein
MGMTYGSPLYKVYNAILTPIGKISWSNLKTKITGKKYYNLTDDDLNKIRELLAANYFICLTFRKTVMSSYLIQFANFVKTGSFGTYDHVLLNVEGGSPTSDDKFCLYESTALGCSIDPFMSVFDCDRVALIRPKNLDVGDWEEIVESAKKQIGKPYDDVFDLNDDTHLSCVELIRDSLRGIPEYETLFPNLEAMIKKVGNLTPQMYYDCPDFEVVFEVRR